MVTNASRPVEETRRDENVAAMSAVIVNRKRTIFHRLISATPLFIFILIGYFALELIVGSYFSISMRAELFSLGSYSLSWVEILYLVAMTAAMAELLKVSKPGIDNTEQALLMAAAWVIYLIFFILGATGMRLFSLFTRTEFLFLLLVSAIQVVMAFIINSRTLKRTIDNTNLGT